jgi:uncharacterized protein YbjT (DUF2867 family)
MRAFVAGATGYTGREVVRELRAHGLAAVAHVRPDSPKLAEWEARFQAHYAVVDTAPWELHTLRESLERWQPTHIFALLGTTRARVRQARSQGADDSYETVDYGLTSMLLRAQLLTGRVARFVYLSSIGVNSKTRNPYLAVRWRMESELRESGLPYIIARPGLITGSDREERRWTERSLAMASDALLTLVGTLGARKLRARFQSMTGAQLATALVHAAVDERYTNVILDSAQLRELADH